MYEQEWVRASKGEEVRIFFGRQRGAVTIRQMSFSQITIGRKTKKHPGPFGYLVLHVLKGAAWGSSFGAVSS